VNKGKNLFVSIVVSACKPLMEEWAEGQQLFCAGKKVNNAHSI